MKMKLILFTLCFQIVSGQETSPKPSFQSLFRKSSALASSGMNKRLENNLAQQAAHNVTIKPKEDIKVGFVYQNAVESKRYEKAMKRYFSDITVSFRGRTFENSYTLVGVDCYVPKVAVIFFATTSEEYDESSTSAEFFLQIAASTGIPIIAWNADNSGYSLEKNLSDYRILQMAPPIEHQISAMIALLERYNWTRFGVVCAKMAGDEQFGYSLRDEIERAKKRIKLEIIFESIIDAMDESHIEEELLRLKRSQAKVILFYANHQFANKIMKKGQELEVVNEKYLWIGTQSVKSTRTTMPQGNLQEGMLAVTFNTLSDAIITIKEDVVESMLPIAAKLIARAAISLSEPISLKSTASCRYSTDTEPTWKDGQILYNALKRSMAQDRGQMDHHNTPFLYSFDQFGRLNSTVLNISNLKSNCEKQRQLCWQTVGSFMYDHLQMEDVHWPGAKANPPQMTADKYHLRVVTLHEPPFIVVSDVDADTGKCPGNRGVALCDWGDMPEGNGTIWKCCSGYCVDLLDKLANDMGFDFTLYKVRDEKWGIKTETGWNGLPQDLITGKADMCVTALKLNSERAKDIDFSVPFLDTGISIIVKIRSGVLSPTAFLEPFEYSMWATILFVCIQGAALFIFVFEWVSPYSFNMQKYPPPDHKFSLCRSYWLVWATLFQASVSTDVPRSFASRFMALAWAAFGLTFLALYTANLAAFMITRVQFYDLSGINDSRLWYPEDVKPPFRYGTVEGGNTHETMRKNWLRMNDYIYKQRFFKTNISAGVEAVVREELDAFIYDAVVLDYWAGKEADCQLMTVGKWASMTGYGIGLPKNSPLTPQVNHWMLQYQHNGDLERLQNFWLTGSCTPDGHGQTHSVPLGTENFMSAFFLLAAGIIVSVIVLGCEFFYVKHLREPLKRIDPDGACGLISMALGKSLTLQDAVGRVSEWRKRATSLLPVSPKKKLSAQKVSPKRDPDRLCVESHF